MFTLGLAPMISHEATMSARAPEWIEVYAAQLAAYGLYHALAAAEHPSWCGAGTKGVTEDPGSCTCGRAEALARYEKWRGVSTNETQAVISEGRAS